MCSDYRLQFINLYKVTTKFVKAFSLMVRVFEANFSLSIGVRPGRNNVADLLSKNPLDEKRVRVALLTRSASNRSFQPVAADIGRSAPMKMTNTRRNPPGYNNEFFDTIIARYALDLWFKDPVNLTKLVFKDAIW